MTVVGPIGDRMNLESVIIKRRSKREQLAPGVELLMTERDDFVIAERRVRL
jgi:hypothetical protein